MIDLPSPTPRQVATEGGFAFSSAEHAALLERVRELGASTTGGAGTSAAATSRGVAQGSSTAPVARSREAMESAYGVSLAGADLEVEKSELIRKACIPALAIVLPSSSGSMRK